MQRAHPARGKNPRFLAENSIRQNRWQLLIMPERWNGAAKSAEFIQLCLMLFAKFPKRVQILCEVMSNLWLIHSMVQLLSLISNKSMMATQQKNGQRSSDLKDAAIFACRGMQHEDRTVSQGNRSKISHEEKHWLAIMQTLDLVPWRAHFSGKEPPGEDPGQFHHCK